MTLRDRATGQVRASVLVGPGATTAAVLDENRVTFLTESGEVRLWDTASSELANIADTADPVTFGRLVVSMGGQVAWETGAVAVDEFDPVSGEKGNVHSAQEPGASPEPLAWGALRPSLPEEAALALEQLFDHRLLSEEFVIQQAVAGLAELEGRLQGNRIVLEANIPPGSPNISDRAWVVVVIDGVGAPSPLTAAAERTGPH